MEDLPVLPPSVTDHDEPPVDWEPVAYEQWLERQPPCANCPHPFHGDVNICEVGTWGAGPTEPPCPCRDYVPAPTW